MPVSSTATVTPLPMTPVAVSAVAPVVVGNTAAGARTVSVTPVTSTCTSGTTSMSVSCRNAARSVADTSAATAFAMLRSPTALPWWAFTLSPALWAFLETTMTRAVGPSDVADASGAIAPSINNAEAPAAAAPRPDTRCQIPERPGR